MSSAPIPSQARSSTRPEAAFTRITLGPRPSALAPVSAEQSAAIEDAAQQLWDSKFSETDKKTKNAKKRRQTSAMASLSEPKAPKRTAATQTFESKEFFAPSMRQEYGQKSASISDRSTQSIDETLDDDRCAEESLTKAKKGSSKGKGKGLMSRLFGRGK